MGSYIVIVEGIRVIIEAVCLVEARYKVRKINAKLIGSYPVEDYRLIKKY